MLLWKRCNVHCVKSVQIRSFSGPYFPAFGLNTEGVSPSIQSECRKISTRKNSVFGHFSRSGSSVPHCWTKYLQTFSSFNPISRHHNSNGTRLLSAIFLNQKILRKSLKCLEFMGTTRPIMQKANFGSSSRNLGKISGKTLLKKLFVHSFFHNTLSKIVGSKTFYDF